MARKPTKKRAVDPADERSHRDASGETFALHGGDYATSQSSRVPVTAAPSLSPAEKAAAGAAWLDRVKPGWWLLCLADVSIVERAKDPLHLAFGGGPWATTDALRLLMESREVEVKDRYTGSLVKTWIARRPERIYTHGFFPDPALGPLAYVELDQCWRREVSARRQR